MSGKVVRLEDFGEVYTGKSGVSYLRTPNTKQVDTKTGKVKYAGIQIDRVKAYSGVVEGLIPLGDWFEVNVSSLGKPILLHRQWFFEDSGFNRDKLKVGDQVEGVLLVDLRGWGPWFEQSATYFSWYTRKAEERAKGAENIYGSRSD